MNQKTADELYEHHKGCGSHEFTRGTVQRDNADNRFYLYRCLKCGWEAREPVEADPVEQPAQQAA